MRLLRFLVGLAAVGLLAGVVLGYGAPLFFELDLLAHFRPHLLGLSGGVLLAALVLRMRAAIWRAVAAAVLALAGLAPLWTDPVASPGLAGDGMTVTVMAANIYFHNEQPGAMRRALIAADADILVTAETSRDIVGAADAPGATGAPALAEFYPYHFIYEPRTPDWRTVLWSKMPIRQVDPVLLDEHGGSGGVRAVIELEPGRELSVVGVHISHVSLGQQQAQVEDMDAAIAGLPRPLVIMGDFNATAWSWAVRRIQALTGTQRLGGMMRTWRGEYPTPFVKLPEPFGLPIDHILVSRDLSVAEIGTVDIPGSDHDAVRAVLRVRE